MFDVTKFVGDMQEYIARAMQPLSMRIKAIEDREPQKGEPGKDGQDGASFTIDDAEKLLDTKIAQWALDFERRAQASLEKAMDRIPAPKDGDPGKDGADGKNGKDGLDGLGFDDLDVQFDGERCVTLTFTKGTEVKEFPIRLPALIYRGQYEIGKQYEQHDSVTMGGSVWVAQMDKPESRPGVNENEWKLAVKKGRDIYKYADRPADREPTGAVKLDGGHD